MLSYQYPERKRKSPSCSAPVLKLTYLIDSNCTWMMVFLTVGTCNNHSIFKKEERRGEGIFDLFWFWVWLGLIHQILFGWHLVILMLGTTALLKRGIYFTNVSFSLFFKSKWGFMFRKRKFWLCSEDLTDSAMIISVASWTMLRCLMKSRWIQSRNN